MKQIASASDERTINQDRFAKVDEKLTVPDILINLRYELIAPPQRAPYSIAT